MRGSVHSPANYLRAARREPRRFMELADLPQARFDAWWAMWTRVNPKATPAKYSAAMARIRAECGLPGKEPS